MKEIRNSFLIDLNEDIDFFWVCAGRVFYYISTSGVVFLYYYIRDMVVTSDEAAVRSHLATLVITAQLVGAACSIPCSQLSNKVGRKVVIYGANALMATTFVLYTIAPKCGVFTWPAVLCAGICYGIGSGAYLSVDYALALDCMPAGKTTAEAFGLWGVAGFLGSTVGPLLGGYLLSASVPTGSHRWPRAAEASEVYPWTGYALVLLLTGSCMNAVVAFLTSKINGCGKACLV
jgi:MFS family permease